jgi:NAD(P)-dependent dehydrogenase (short-subunit alcohol dehydrogenase family)
MAGEGAGMGGGRDEAKAAGPLGLFRLDGAVAAVTGGASGIGRAVAEAYAAVGARVLILDRDEAGARAAAAAIGGAAEAHPFDVADEAAIERVFGTIAERHGRLDVLFNNAGTAIRRPTTELTLEEWNKVVAVNMTGVFLCAREAARIMLAKDGGRIVNTASIMGLSGGGLYPNISYQTTKGAVVNMTRALAVEWARQGIRVNAVAPTYVRTPFIAGLVEKPELVAAIERMTPMGRLADPEELVGAVLFLSTRASSMVTGHILAVDGGFLAQ